MLFTYFWRGMLEWIHSDGLVRIESMSERIPLVYEMRNTNEFE